MPHCNTAIVTQPTSRIRQVSALVGVRFDALVALVLVLLITNGGAG